MKALEERLRRAAYSAENDPDFMAAWSPLAISDLLEEAQEEIARLRVSHAEHCPAHPVNAACVCAWTGEGPAEKWQPMDTAPKDGSRFIAYDPRVGLLFSMHYDGGFLTDFERWSGTFTHWMPLPPAPTAARVAGMRVVTDPTLPPGVVEFRDGDRVLGRITNTDEGE